MGMAQKYCSARRETEGRRDLSQSVESSAARRSSDSTVGGQAPRVDGSGQKIGQGRDLAQFTVRSQWELSR